MRLYLISLIVRRLTPNVDTGAFYCIGQDLLGKNYTFSLAAFDTQKNLLQRTYFVTISRSLPSAG